MRSGGVRCRLARTQEVDGHGVAEVIGLLLAIVVLLDGALMATSLSLAGDRGSFLSMDTVLLGTLATFAVVSDAPRRALRLAFTGDLALAFLLLLFLIPLAALRTSPAESGVWLSSHLVEVLRWSAMGAMATLCVTAPGQSVGGRVRGTWGPTLVATGLLWGAFAWMWSAGLGAMRVDLFYIIATGGDYYQLLGDTIGVAVVAVMTLQWRSLASFPGPSASASIAFMLLVVLQGLAAVVLLQLFGSNKAPVLVMLCVCVALWEAMPASDSGTNRRARMGYVLTFLLLLAFLAVTLARVELPPVRLLNFGADGGLLAGSSVTSRNEFLREAWLEQLADGPIFGNPTIGIMTGAYLHSSILSLQASLGVLGTLVFGAIMFLGWQRVRRDPAYMFIRLLALPVLLVSAVSSFFTWGPLWLLLGAIATVPSPLADTALPRPHSRTI